jgi:CBS domain-containing protein
MAETWHLNTLNRRAEAQSTLRQVMRAAPGLAPEDSIRRFLSLVRGYASTALPIQANGKLVGVVSLEDALAALADAPAQSQEALLDRPVATLLRPPVATLLPDSDVTTMRQQFTQHRLPMIPVVDTEGFCHGFVLANDLLLPDPAPLYPGPVGGMATPMGVYLTNGTLRAGVGDLALIASGLVIGSLYAVAASLVTGLLWMAHRYAGWPFVPVYDLSYQPPSGQPILGLFALGLFLFSLLVFLLLLRSTRLAGYHAAEHQTVHAMERQERLVPEIVSRMPRPHPRCGTNLLSAGILFFSLFQICENLPYLNPLALLVALIGTLLGWRPLGMFLQQYLATRPASAPELASGIAAGQELTRKYLHSPPARMRPLRRLWCMGFLQTALGWTLSYGLFLILVSLWEQYLLR